MRYTLEFNDLATGSTGDTYKTFAALIAADTAGYRARLRSLNVGPADDTPQDKTVSIKLCRVDSVSGGSAGTAGTSVTGANMRKKDSLSADSTLTGGVNYSAEPSTYGNPLFQMDFNTRGGFFKEWSIEDAPVVNRNQLLGVLAAPRSSDAIRLSGSLEYEIF